MYRSDFSTWMLKSIVETIRKHYLATKMASQRKSIQYSTNQWAGPLIRKLTTDQVNSHSIKQPINSSLTNAKMLTIPAVESDNLIGNNCKMTITSNSI